MSSRTIVLIIMKISHIARTESYKSRASTAQILFTGPGMINKYPSSLFLLLMSLKDLLSADLAHSDPEQITARHHWLSTLFVFPYSLLSITYFVYVDHDPRWEGS